MWLGVGILTNLATVGYVAVLVLAPRASETPGS